MDALGIIAGTLCIGLMASVVFDAAQGYLQAVLAKSRSLNLLPTGKLSPSLAARIVFADLCRNGFPWLKPLSNLLGRWRAVNVAADTLVIYLGDQGFQTSRQATLQLGMMLFVAVAAVSLLLFGDPLVAAACAAVALFFIWHKASASIKKERGINNEQLPDVIHTIGLCFSSGLSLQQAMAHTAREVSGQMSQLLDACASDMQAGRSVDEALANLEQRCEISDVRFVAVALEIQHLTGGGLSELLESAAQAIRCDIELKRSLKVQTAQARLSAQIVTMLPLALVVLLSLAMEGYLATFFSSFEGFSLLLTAAVLEVSGILLVRRALANGAGL